MVKGGSWWVPGGFRLVPDCSGRFRVGSAFYIHPFFVILVLDSIASSTVLKLTFGVKTQYDSICL